MAQLKKLLVLDLDETLIYATKEPLPGRQADHVYGAYFVYLRPHLKHFLTEAAMHFSLAIWSSAGDTYVSDIVGLVTFPGISFELVWGRTRCSMKRDLVFDTYCFEKRLDKLKKKGFALEQILLVDDTPEKAASNYGNAIYIKEFKGESSDDELLRLLAYLLTLKAVENVRLIEKRYWRSG